MSYILLGNSCNYKTNCITDNTKYFIPDNIVAKVSRKTSMDIENDEIENSGKVENEENTFNLLKKKVNYTMRRIKEGREK